jgi:electron transport complex protein RnfG
MSKILKPAIALFIITALATALLGYARDMTREPIENQRKKTQERTLKAVLPQASSFREVPLEPSGSIVRAFEGIAGNETIGFVIELAPPGYSGNINMMVGISKTDQRISGMRILKHTETPGLGAKASTESFYRKFDNKRLIPLKVIKTTARYEDEIEAITASTITSRAVTNAVNEAVEWYLSFEERWEAGE